RGQHEVPKTYPGVENAQTRADTNQSGRYCGLQARPRTTTTTRTTEPKETSMPDPAVLARGVRKRYGTTVALDGIDLGVDHGEVFGLLGPNGAGKTTFCEILEGHRRRDEGEVKVLGYDPAEGRQEFKDRIGVVLQEAGHPPTMTVIEAV